MTQTILTVEGKHRLQEEINVIRSTYIPKAEKRVAEAEHSGDEWFQSDAKNELDFYVKRLSYLENMVATAKIIGWEAKRHGN